MGKTRTGRPGCCCCTAAIVGNSLKFAKIFAKSAFCCDATKLRNARLSMVLS